MRKNVSVAATLGAVVLVYFMVRWFLVRQMRPGSFTEQYAKRVWV
jgi:hypothetical protein